MKNICLTLSLATLLVPVLGHTDDGSFWEKQPENVEIVTKVTPFYEYHNRMVVFSPTHQAYERIKPDDMYWGIEGWYVRADNKHKNWLLNGEFRVGHNYLYNLVDHVTPFAGVGYIQDFSKHYHNYHKPGIVYGTVGMLYDHEFNSVFTLGVNLKGLVGGPASKKHFNWGSPVVGADMSIPITFRLGHNRHWDLRLEPFNTYLYGTHACAYYVGSRCTVGYRF